MSVIIKGMKLPKGCDSCELVQDYDEDSACCPFLRSESWYGAAPDYRLEQCPLIEISTPHGRLIDVDKLFKAFNKAYQTNGYWTNSFALVDEAPTVVEAEVSE